MLRACATHMTLFNHKIFTSRELLTSFSRCHSLMKDSPSTLARLITISSSFEDPNSVNASGALRFISQRVAQIITVTSTKL